jgi:hypothetical protein
MVEEAKELLFFTAELISPKEKEKERRSVKNELLFLFRKKM